MRTRTASVLFLAALTAASLHGQTDESKSAAAPHPALETVYADLDYDGSIDLLLVDEEGVPILGDIAYLGRLFAQAQQEKPKPGSGQGGTSATQTAQQAAQGAKPFTLEQMLSQAIKNHPDIRVAEAKVREAEAELDRAKLQVTQKVIAVHRAIEDQRAQVRAGEQQVQDQSKLVQKGFTSKGDLERTQQVLTDRKAKLAELEMELPYLLGRQARDSSQALLDHLAATRLTQRLDQDLTMTAQSLRLLRQRQDDPALTLSRLALGASRPVGEPMAERIRKALDTPVSIKYKEVALTDVLKDLEKQVPGVPFVPRLQGNAKLTLELSEKVPLSAALQAIEDLGRIRFGVRDYGILGVDDGDMLVSPRDFRRQSAAPAWNPPAKEVQGEIRAVDEKTGLIEISIGSDAGVQKGNTLEVYRLKPKPKYLGPIQLIEVKPKESVGKPARPSGEPMQVGDQVSGAPPQRN